MTWLLTWLRPRYMCISIWKLPMTEFISFVHYLSLDIQPSLLNLMLSNKIAENLDLGYPLPRQGFFYWGGGGWFYSKYTKCREIQAFTEEQKSINDFLQTFSAPCIHILLLKKHGSIAHAYDPIIIINN